MNTADRTNRATCPRKLSSAEQNTFCSNQDLRNEADVEALFIEPLIKDFGYPNNSVKRKATIEEVTLPTAGSRVERYRPDFVLMDSTGKPVVVLDAKHPDENPSRYRYQVTGYALMINQRHDDNPLRYCVLSNGNTTELLEWDKASPIMVARFSEFEKKNEKYISLRAAISYAAFNQQQAIKKIRPKFHRPTISEVLAMFGEAHYTIWKSDKISPTDAFYELAKLLFVKLKQDRAINDFAGGGGG